MPPEALPLHLADADTFAAVRALFLRCDYTDAGVRRRLGIDALHDFVTRRDGRTTGTSLDDPLDACIRLFLDAESVPDALLQQWRGTEALTSVRTTGLIEQSM